MADVKTDRLVNSTECKSENLGDKMKVLAKGLRGTSHLFGAGDKSTMVRMLIYYIYLLLKRYSV